MTGMLASVNSLAEAHTILETSVDIIDLKQPEQGALGALSTETVKQIVQAVNSRKLLSATIGDIPMQAEQVYKAANAMADTGVDYIKIGLFPGGNWSECLNALNQLSKKGSQLIAVLFADTQPDYKIIETLKHLGFTGVMLDTMDKSKGSLSEVMQLSDIENFVNTAKSHQLLSGLAGSLKKADIPELIDLEADYLGFRGALCEGHNRKAKLNLDSINTILDFFKTVKLTSTL